LQAVRTGVVLGQLTICSTAGAAVSVSAIADRQVGSPNST
jgi:hypothetical protein